MHIHMVCAHTQFCCNFKRVTIVPRLRTTVVHCAISIKVTEQEIGKFWEDNNHCEDKNQDQIPKFFCQIFSLLLEYIITQREWHILKLNV